MVNGFLMLPSYYDAIRPLPDEQRLALYDAIMDYAFSGKEPDDLSPILKGYFVLLRPNIDSSSKRYSASVGNGKKGGRPPKEKPNENPDKTQAKPSENQEKEKEKDKEKEMEREMEGMGDAPPALTPTQDQKTRSHFVPPTLEEVAAYVRERGSRVDPQQFIDFYAAKGWMVGRNKMKDWKAACRNAEKWERWQRGGARNEVKTASDYESGDDFFTR